MIPVEFAYSLPFRLTVGVTGHRELKETENLRRSIQEVLGKILSMHPGSRRTQVKTAVLSPLAEGADRMVVTEILKTLPDAVLKAVLPLSLSDYLEDFETETSRDAFLRLLHTARNPLYLREKSIHEEYPENLSRQARRLAYEEAGRFVVDHCDVLIALWDGKPAHSRGGTAQIVQYARDQECPLFIISTDNPTHIAFEKGSEVSKKLCRALENFNKRIQDTPPDPDYMENQFKLLFDTPSSGSVSEGTRRLIRKYVIPYYVITSSLAKRYQSTYRRVGLGVFWMAFVSVFVVGLGVIFFHSHPTVFFIEFLFLGLISLLILWANRIRSHKNWMEHRFLAERLRSTFFFAACHTEITPIHVNRRSIVDQTSAWTLIALDEIWNLMPRQTGCEEQSCRSLGEFVVKAWIDDQITYHREQVHRTSKKKSRRLESFGEAVFFTALSVALIHAIWGLFSGTFHESKLARVLTLAALTLPAMGAMAEAIRTHREYKRLAIRSKRMVVELNDAKAAFQLLTPDKLDRLLRRTEQVMIRETQEWLDLMSFAELHRTI